MEIIPVLIAWPALAAVLMPLVSDRKARGVIAYVAAGGMMALALAVFQERGLISLSLQGDQMTLALNPIQGKVDLFACPYLSRLREEDSAGRNGGALS